MKRLVIIAILVAANLGAAFAQTTFAMPDKVTISGILAFVQGRIVVQSADTAYFTGGDLDKLVGFVDGFKEGASVQIEGYVFARPGDDMKFIRTLKVAFNGKDYEMRADFQNNGYFGRMNFNSQHHPRGGNKTFSPDRNGFYPHHNDWNRHHPPRY
jgi:hypothetical protein